MVFRRHSCIHGNRILGDVEDRIEVKGRAQLALEITWEKKFRCRFPADVTRFKKYRIATRIPADTRLEREMPPHPGPPRKNGSFLPLLSISLRYSRVRAVDTPAGFEFLLIDLPIVLDSYYPLMRPALVARMSW